MSDKRYRVRWKATNCSGYFNRTFEDKEDAEMFAQGWLLDCMDGILDGFDYGDSYTYEVIGSFLYLLLMMHLIKCILMMHLIPMDGILDGLD